MTDVLQRPAETASAAPGSAEPASPAAGEGWACPECDHRSPSEVGLKIHFRRKHPGIPEPQWTEKPQRRLEEAAAAPAPPGDQVGDGGLPTRTQAEYEALRRRAVEAFKNAGGLVFLIGLQVTAFAIDNRAERLSFQAIAYAQRSERFAGILEGFCTVLTATELAKLGSELGMAVGVDVGVLHPARPVRFGPVNVPGLVFLRPIQREMEQVGQLRLEAQRLQQEYEQAIAQARAAENGVRPQDAR